MADTTTSLSTRTCRSTLSSKTCRRSEFCTSGRAGKGNNVADVTHAAQEEQRPLQAEAEPGVRHGAVAAEVQVPLVRRRIEPLLPYLLLEHIGPLLALAAADDLADAGGEHIHGPHGFA